ncbi:MAG: hypothetical protein RL547_2056 [Actinomycetota bacterium]
MESIHDLLVASELTRLQSPKNPTFVVQSDHREGAQDSVGAGGDLFVPVGLPRHRDQFREIVQNCFTVTVPHGP